MSNEHIKSHQANANQTPGGQHLTHTRAALMDVRGGDRRQLGCGEIGTACFSSSGINGAAFW